MLAPGELITAVELPPLRFAGALALPQGARPRLLRLRLVSVAAAVDVADGDGARRPDRLGGVAHAPWRALRGRGRCCAARPATRGALRRAAEAELAQAQPLRDNALQGRRWRATCIVRTLAELCEAP